MISIIAAFIGGIVTGTYTPLFSPVFYLLRSKKGFFLISFSAYCISLGYEVELGNLYDTDLLLVFAIVLPTILLLDAGLKGERWTSIRKWGPVSYLSISLIIGSLLIKELFIIGVLLAFLYNFSEDNPRKGSITTLVGISLLIAGLFAVRSILNLPGSAPSQVTFISAVSILLTLIFWKSIQKVKIFF
ncbi:MAG: hypothetical protein H0Z28_09620 [Archaeoglobus sp.]|nr:hypothetical protein [Archaeoglobus sp.]